MNWPMTIAPKPRNSLPQSTSDLAASGLAGLMLRSGEGLEQVEGFVLAQLPPEIH